MQQQELYRQTSYVSTHRGNISTDELGITLMHEHIFNRFPFQHRLKSETFTLSQLRAIQHFNVKTIVDLTPYTTPANYSAVLRGTDLNIITCVGFYLQRYIPSPLRQLSVHELCKRLARHIENGRGNIKVRPGILKVAAHGADLTNLESRCFNTVSILQRQYRLPIATHSPKGALSHLQELIRAGADPEHVFLSHLDKGVASKSKRSERLQEMRKILDAGAHLLFSEFGTNMVNGTRTAAVDLIIALRNEGYIKQLLISADSNWRWRRGEIRLKSSQFQGAPRTYDYVFSHIIPVLKAATFTSDEINEMLIRNPRRLFEF